MNDDIEQKYIALVQRIRRMPGPACDKAAMLTEVVAIYRREAGGLPAIKHDLHRNHDDQRPERQPTDCPKKDSACRRQSVLLGCNARPRQAVVTPMEARRVAD